jgi:hypothetical protein
MCVFSIDLKSQMARNVYKGSGCPTWASTLQVALIVWLV